MLQAPICLEKPVALVGLMGAGKSTVGLRLAETLGLPFADSDAEIEAAAGLSIAEMFERHGEARFRDEERQAIARLIDRPAGVIATGGGAFADSRTRALIQARGISVWLDADAASLAERAGRGGHRPLLEGQDPHLVLARLAAERAPAYATAHFQVRCDGLPPEAIVERILGALCAEGLAR